VTCDPLSWLPVVMRTAIILGCAVLSDSSSRVGESKITVKNSAVNDGVTIGDRPDEFPWISGLSRIRRHYGIQPRGKLAEVEGVLCGGLIELMKTE